MKKTALSKKSHNSLIKEIIEALEESKRSEDFHDYADSDGEGWGPSMGLAAQVATEYNRRIPDLIRFLKSLKR